MMSSAFLSPIGERPIDPEEADDELNADQVHKEWKEYYEHQKKEMEREHKIVVRCLEKLREEIAKVRDLLTSESRDLVANALREASNPERFNKQMYNMMVNIGKNVVYRRHKVTETFLTLVFLGAHPCRVGYREKSITQKGGGGGDQATWLSHHLRN
jgi:hypothetical protein